MNFLQLCQRVVAEGGIARSTTTMATVSGQTGRLLDVVNWVNDAYEMIQNRHMVWHFMRAPFTLAVAATNSEYLPSAAQDTRGTPAVITNHASWIVDDFLIYDNAIGLADQHSIGFVGWEYFKDMYRIGAAQYGPPNVITVRPYDKALVLGPTPELPYTLTGEYYRSASRMAADADTHVLPPQYEMAIVWQAINLYAMNEEAPTLIATSNKILSNYLSRMELTHLPEIGFGAPLVA